MCAPCVFMSQFQRRTDRQTDNLADRLTSVVGPPYCGTPRCYVTSCLS